MNVRRGEVVLVDFPYSDHTGSKVRPALVVQADAWNQHPDIAGKGQTFGNLVSPIVQEINP